VRRTFVSMIWITDPVFGIVIEHGACDVLVCVHSRSSLNCSSNLHSVACFYISSMSFLKLLLVTKHPNSKGSHCRLNMFKYVSSTVYMVVSLGNQKHTLVIINVFILLIYDTLILMCVHVHGSVKVRLSPLYK